MRGLSPPTWGRRDEFSAGDRFERRLRQIGSAAWHRHGEGEGEAVVGKNGAGKSTLLSSFFEAITLQAGRQAVWLWAAQPF